MVIIDVSSVRAFRQTDGVDVRRDFHWMAQSQQCHIVVERARVEVLVLNNTGHVDVDVWVQLVVVAGVPLADAHDQVLSVQPAS